MCDIYLNLILKQKKGLTNFNLIKESLFLDVVKSVSFSALFGFFKVVLGQTHETVLKNLHLNY